MDFSTQFLRTGLGPVFGQDRDHLLREPLSNSLLSTVTELGYVYIHSRANGAPCSISRNVSKGSHCLKSGLCLEFFSKSFEMQ